MHINAVSYKGYLYLFLLVCVCSSCDKEDVSEAAEKQQQIVTLFSPGGLGDMGYNDRILRGVQTIKKAHPQVEMLFYTPRSVEEGEEVFRSWLTAVPDKDAVSLFVLAGSEYEAMAADMLQGVAQPPHGKMILLFESDNTLQLPLRSFRITMYGASYLAGVTAATLPAGNVLVVLANAIDQPIRHAADGFGDGFTVQSGKEVDYEYLAEDWTGYVSADKAYRNMGTWAETYNFIFPVAGGSNVGIYRYTREYPGGLYTAGMDVDQSPLSSQIVGSVIKHIDRLIVNYLSQWITEGTMPQQQVYGLESGYIDWQVPAAYEEAFQPEVKRMRTTAIQKEKEHEDTNGK
jgi:basic membrane protein A